MAPAQLTLADLPERLRAMDDLLRAIYPADGPGAAALVVVNGAPALLQGYGLADVEAGHPVTPVTVFDLASVSKQLTGLAVLLLAQRGLLSLDDPLGRHLPGFSGARPHLRDLLHHSSGLPDYTAAVDPAHYSSFTNDRLAEWAATQPPTFTPGSQGYFLHSGDTYSNTNYVLLACVVERILGLPFPEFLDREVFRPLGMNATTCDPWQAWRPGRARRYGRDGLPLVPREIPTTGDGNVYSTVEDFLRWDRELSSPTLLDPAWLQTYFTPGHLDDGTRTSYACGWYVSQPGGRRVFWHGGSWDGTSTCYSRWPEEGFSVALFSNTQQARAAAVAGQIEQVLLAP